MRIQWVGSPDSKPTIGFFITALIIFLSYGFSIVGLIHIVGFRKGQDQTIAKQEQIISELEYKLLNCRMNTINEILNGGEIKVDGSKLDPPPPVKPMEIRKSN